MTSSTTPTLSLEEANVYREAVRAAFYHCKTPNEPTADECRAASAMFSRLERLLRAADARREVLEPGVLPLLEKAERDLRRQVRDGDAPDASAMLRAAEGLIARFEAYTLPVRTLTECVFSLLTEERPNGSQRVLEGVSQEPRDGARLTRRELDIRDWALTFGLAFGVALIEADAMEDRNSIRDTAVEAARAAYIRWGGKFAARPSLGDIDRVILAVEEAGPLTAATAGDLDEALTDLVETFGAPAR
jgi:hypothetical protein